MTTPPPARGHTGPGPRDSLLPGSFRLGRIGGVPIGVHWSVVIIMALIAWGLGGSALPTAYPGQPGWVYALAGIAGAAVFLLGLLAHEASHAIVARRNQVPVTGITLWLLGGVAQLGGEAEDPGAELRIAGVGPLVSFLLGGAFAGLAALADAAGAAGLVVGVLSWLAGINLLLAVFNILPGAPLDGGRLLRAALWKWRGDKAWAAITAARTGRALGVALVALGLIDFVLAADTSGLWLALVGWFILGAAGAEERAAQLGVALTGVRVGDVMTADPDTAPSWISVAEFVDRYLFAHRHSTFPLVDNGVPVGLVTLSRVRGVPEEARGTTSLRRIASPMDDVPVAAPEDPLAELVPRMNRHTDGRALVLRDGVLVGIVSPADVTRALERAALRRPVGAPPR